MLSGGGHHAGRRSLLLSLGIVVLAGLGSRLVHSGFPLLDKYLGDTLYAVMVYLLLALCRPGTGPLRRGAVAMAVMTGLELFQLTGVPLAMVVSGNVALKVVGKLLGTTFSRLDLVAYGVGIAVVVFRGAWSGEKSHVREKSEVLGNIEGL